MKRKTQNDEKNECEQMMTIEKDNIYSRYREMLEKREENKIL